MAVVAFKGEGQKLRSLRACVHTLEVMSKRRQQVQGQQRPPRLPSKTAMNPDNYSCRNNEDQHRGTTSSPFAFACGRNNWRDAHAAQEHIAVSLYRMQLRYKRVEQPRAVPMTKPLLSERRSQMTR